MLRRHGVPHYWLIDREREVLTAHRWVEGVYAVVTHAVPGERRAREPFEGHELDVSRLFGRDPTE